MSTRGPSWRVTGWWPNVAHPPLVPPWFQPFCGCHGPNEVWSVDFKGWFRTQDGSRCDPLTVSDAFSRMLLCAQVVSKTDYAHVRTALERTFRHYGLPRAIRMDNGVPFASVGAGGLSPLSAWWVKLGILRERIALGTLSRTDAMRGCT